ncbi:hypothetical protein GCM10009561_20500 [Frigoribacterium faeni]|nr:hypothetical protein GCM10025699_69560 [Microbacterium flavescens]
MTGRRVVHDEALDARDEVVTIAQVAREGLPKAGWRCAGATPDGVECRRPLTARALESELVAPYFAGTHIDSCSRSSLRSADAPGDRGHVVAQGPRATRWRLRLDDDEPRQGPDGRRRPDDSVPGDRTRRSAVDRSAPPRPTEDPHSLSAFLDAALAGDLPVEAALPGGPWMPGGDLIVPAAEATAARFAGGQLIVWGRVVATRPTSLGGTMLVFDGAADGLAVLIRKEHRGYYPLADDREFVPRHVMTYGRRAGSDARPYVTVPAPRGVVFSPTVHVRSTPKAGDGGP